MQNRRADATERLLEIAASFRGKSTRIEQRDDLAGVDVEGVPVEHGDTVERHPHRTHVERAHRRPPDHGDEVGGVGTSAALSDRKSVV